MTSSPSTARNLIKLLWHRKFRICAVFALVFALSLGAVYFFPQSYSSEAKLLVKLGRESVTLDPTATFGQTISISQDRQQEINSTLEILKSRELREKVVDHLGVDAIIGVENENPSFLTLQKRRVKSLVKGVLNMPNISRREIAILSLENSVDIDSPKLTSVINITATADSPETAQKIVQAYTQAYVKEHVRLYHTAGSYLFFEEQRDELAKELATAEDELRITLNGAKLLSIDGRRGMLESQINELETRILNNERELTAARSKVAAIEERVAGLSPMVVSQSTEGFANAASDGMRQQLYDLEIQERKVQQQYTADHPEVIAVQKQLAEVRKILEKQAQGRTQVTNMLNPLHQKLTQELLDYGTLIESLAKEATTLAAQQTSLQGSLEKLNNQQPKIAAMQRKIEVLAANYRTHSEHLEQSRVENALALDEFSNVRVFQTATLAERPSSPRVKAMLLLGFVAAAFAGLGSAFLGDLRQFELQPVPQVSSYLAEAR